MRRAIFEVGAYAYDVLTRQTLWRAQIRRVLDHARSLPDAPRVLDIGCGPGVSSFVLAEALGPRAEVVGVDLSSRMIHFAERHHRERFTHLPNVRFQQGDATRLAFPDASFDLAVGHSFLYLVPDRARVLAELHRVLAPGGRLVLMEPNERGSIVEALFEARAHASEALEAPSAAARFATSMMLWRAFSRAAGRMSPELVDALFSEAGFEAVECHPTLGGLGLHCVAVRGGPAVARSSAL